ncbi:MAG TPA: 16S rRNA (cytidine(1402)-2'-O)-methyltransferase [Polyangia bacterium]|nr:16S rRNA (cytidine(1402)-2'-O)-methyltransferase [Polyangia bacterium]
MSPPPEDPTSAPADPAPPAKREARAAGRLYVVATPIGNLEDITYRAVRILSSVELIAAEDTRAAQVLLGRYGITTKVLSYFEGNEAARAEELTARLRAGAAIAVISEAGTPGISDPGERLVKAAIAAGVPVEVVPGPSAAITALVGSGLPGERFLFLGFPPREAGPRQEGFARLRGEIATLILYESPRRTGTTLADLAATLGEARPACVARELTKVHEEYVRGTLGELAARYAEEAPRGEVVIVVAGAAPEAAAAPVDLEAEVRARLARGERPREIAAALALLTGQPRRKIYQLALALSPER